MSRARVLGSGLLIANLALAACGGGGSHAGGGTVPLPGAPPSSAPVPRNSASATFAFTIPGAATSSLLRRAGGTRTPRYVSAATKSIAIALTSASNGLPSPNPPAVYNVPNGGSGPGSTTNATCTPSGQDFVCQVVDVLPIGTDGVTITTYDAASAAGNVLSQQKATVTVVQGAANGPGGQFAITLDANVGTLTVSGTGSCTTGAVGTAFGSVGTTPVTFSAATADPAGKTIVGPGLPTLRVYDSGNTPQSTSGTIAATGGTVAFTVNQSAQTFTLTPSSSSVTNASVKVDVVPPAADGLGFSAQKTFTFSTGPAAPASFLAVIEQSGPSTGSINFYTVSLGATDTFTGYAVSSLAVTPSTNEGKPDVDNPRALAFDATGNLLIANGGQGGTGGDYGDFACVPAGAIATGATNATTASTNARDPESLAIGTDGSVALGNVPASATDNVFEDVLGTTYTAAPASRDIANAGGLGTFDVLALPTSTANPAGTFAAAITNGTTVSHVAFKHPDGTEVDFTDADVVDPHALGYDPLNNQLAIATFNAASSKLVFASIGASPAKVTSVLIRSDGAGSAQVEGDKLAVSPNGYVAVGGPSGSGNPEVVVYDNTPARNQVNGPIPYDSCTDASCTTNIYGNAVVVTGLHFLSNTKLLVTLSSDDKTKQGAYTYDVTQTQTPAGFDGITLAPLGPSPKQTGFLNINVNTPLGAAYKP